MTDCLFCKIIAGEIPSSIVYENERVFVFKDIHPLTEVHHLIVPKAHIESALEITEENREIVGELFLAANSIAARDGISGYKLQMNVGKDGGQAVMHMHLHMIAGKKLREGEAG